MGTSYFGFIRRLLLWLLLPLLLAACTKHFLEAKPSTNLLVPSTVSDFQSLLDNTTVFNLVPTLGEASCDDYYFPLGFWQGLDTREKNAYVWAVDIFDGQGDQQDWNTPYRQVFYANVVLDGLGNQPEADSLAQWNNVKGEALFSRAFAFYNLSQIFAPAYGTVSDTAHLGIALRLHSDISIPSTRSTVPQTYQQIINDLDSAERYLPALLPNLNSYRNRPVKVCAQALLARVYLSMRNYLQAKTYADSALKYYDSLIDYNTISPLTILLPFTPLNNETIYQAGFLGPNQPGFPPYQTYLVGGFDPNTRVDSGLYQSYDTNDLRRVIYFRYKPHDSTYFKGSYTGTFYPFGGLAIDELYLIRAEGAARMGDLITPANDINMLLSKRWVSGTFPGYSFTTMDQALDTVLLERRKELVFRGLRWTDLRRLNADNAGIELKRVLDTTYILHPNSSLYTLPLPPDVINLSTMQQNYRYN